MDPDVTGLRALFELAPDGILVGDSAGRLTDANEASCRLLGFSRAELVGKTIAELLPGKDEFSESIALLAAGEAQVSEGRLRHKDGQLVPVEASGRMLPDGRLVVFIREISRSGVAEVCRFGNEHCRALFENSMDAVLLTAPDGRVAMVNPAAVAMFGYTAEELRTLGRLAVVDTTDPQVIAALQERRRTGQFRGELTFKRKDGTRFPAEISSAIFRDESGAEWTSMFIRDISERIDDRRERERLAAEVDARRRWLEAVLANVPVAVVLTDKSGSVWANQRAEEMLGMHISPEAGNAQYADRILYRDGTRLTRGSSISSRVIATGETVIGAEFIVERPDGSRISALGSAAPIRGDDGSVIGAVGVFQDLSERMRDEERMRASERLLSTIFEILPVSLWIGDSDGNVLRTNPAALRIWGGPPRALDELERVEVRWEDSDQPIAPDEGPLRRALARGEKSTNNVLRIRTSGGSERVIVRSALPLNDDRGKITGAVVVDQDITELKAVERALRRAVRARDEILGVVAHDLRNPLGAILLQAQRLLDEHPDPHSGAVLERIRQRAMRMSRLIDDLLDIARIDAGVMTLRRAPVEVARILSDIAETEQPLAAQAGIGLTIDAAPAVAVWADRDRLDQVLENLVGNALKFTPAGGQVRVGAVVSEPSVRFWVADTGPGIPDEQREYLFDRFWQASDMDKRGAGLGLAIAKAIVEAHGGRIWVDSRLGEGTVFHFEIPRARPSHLHEPAEPRA